MITSTNWIVIKVASAFRMLLSEKKSSTWLPLKKSNTSCWKISVEYHFLIFVRFFFSNLTTHVAVLVLRAVLKHVLPWNMFQIGIVCHFETCFRLALNKLCHIEADNNPILITHRIWGLTHWICDSPSYINYWKTNKQM